MYFQAGGLERSFIIPFLHVRMEIFILYNCILEVCISFLILWFSKLRVFFNPKEDLNVGLLNSVFGIIKVYETFIVGWMYFSLWDDHEPMDLVGHYDLKWFLIIRPPTICIWFKIPSIYHLYSFELYMREN